MGKKVPAQVQAQADKADEMLKEISEQEKPPATDQAPPENRDQNPPAEETVEGLKQKLAYAEHSLTVLQGKYNAEIQAIKDDVNLLNNLKNQAKQRDRQIGQLTGQLNEANRLISDLQKQITEPKPKAEAGNVADPLSVLSEEERELLEDEGFTEDVMKIVGKLVHAAAPKAQPEESPEQVEQRKRINTFWEELTENVPDWDPINKSEEFSDWLDAMVPYSNQTRRDALKAAQDRLDYATCIQVFQDFKDQVKPAGEAGGGKHKIDPNKQIDPATSVARQTDPEGATPQGKIYTQQEVKDFYRDVSLGKYKGREDEQKRIDTDIVKANLEGRIKP